MNASVQSERLHSQGITYPNLSQKTYEGNKNLTGLTS